MTHSVGYTGLSLFLMHWFQKRSNKNKLQHNQETQKNNSDYLFTFPDSAYSMDFYVNLHFFCWFADNHDCSQKSLKSKLCFVSSLILFQIYFFCKDGILSSLRKVNYNRFINFIFKIVPYDYKNSQFINKVSRSSSTW